MKLKTWDIVGAIFVMVSGTLLHFTYEWSGFNPYVGLIGAVNESTWEHLKLLFWPMLLFSILELAFVGRKYSRFIPSRVISIFAGVFLIPVMFYTYSGILGRNFLAADISVFLLSVVFSFALSYRLCSTDHPIKKPLVVLSLICMIGLTACFVVFTYAPSHIGIFLDPVTATYGIMH